MWQSPTAAHQMLQEQVEQDNKSKKNKVKDYELRSCEEYVQIRMREIKFVSHCLTAE